MAEKQIGQYRILEDIASGTQGAVFRAFEPETGRIVALKVLHQRFGDDSQYLDRFHREASLAASVVHPNVVNIFDVGQDGGQHYIALEFLPADLNRLIETGALPIEIAAGVAAGVADGVGAIHSVGITHRDLKPHNVLITADGTPKVTDFGIARAHALPTNTATGAVLGTPHYMSPEQALGKVADTRSDVYALGCILFQMLTGDPPFDADSAYSVLQKQVEELHDPVHTFRDDVPEALAAIVNKAMEKDPDKRFANGRDMANAIRQAVPGITSTVIQGTSVESTTPSLSLPPSDPAAHTTHPDTSAIAPKRTSGGPPISSDARTDVLRPGPSRLWRAVIAILAISLVSASVIAGFLFIGTGESIEPIDSDSVVADLPVGPPPTTPGPTWGVSLSVLEGQTTLTALRPEIVRQLPIRRLQILPDSYDADGFLYLLGLDSPMSQGVPELPSSRVNRYVEMEVVGLENSSHLPSVVDFEIATTWLNSEELVPSQIDLFRYEKEAELGNWTRLPTSVISETATAVLFRSQVPGFSVFAIGSSTADLISPPPIATPSPIPPPTPTPVPSPTSTALPVPTSTPTSTPTVSPKPTPRATATPRPQSTATPQPTAVSLPFPETFASVSGALSHNPGLNTVKTRAAGVKLKDMVVHARFFNPYSTTRGTWDYGIMFRNSEFGTFDIVVVTSGGRWSHKSRNASDITVTDSLGSGSLTLDTSPRGVNELILIAQGATGSLFVNGTYITSLTLDKNSTLGDVKVVTGWFQDNEIDGESTKYEEFWIGSLTDNPTIPFGTLAKVEDVVPSTVSSQMARDIIAEVEFTVPIQNAEDPWSHGFIFRHPERNTFEAVLVTSQGRWQHRSRMGSVDSSIVVDSGSKFNINRTQRQTNALRLIILDEVGWFFINNSAPIKLNLKGSPENGTVSAISGFFSGDSPDGDGTPFDGFEVWKIHSPSSKSSVSDTPPTPTSIPGDSLPARYSGFVSLNGAVPPDSIPITARIGSSYETTGGAIIDGDFSIIVDPRNSSLSGLPIEFFIDGIKASQTTPYLPGEIVSNIILTFGVSPTPVPIPVPTPTT